jgi:holo-[acyl-carrier protein] synthase
MIIGLGVDLVDIQKIRESIKRPGFKCKVFTDKEIKICEGFANAEEHYAGKFAAKEAFMKAIGHGIRQEIWFTQIEVLNNENGMPFLQLTGEAQRITTELDVEKILLTISHSNGMAVAVVILEAG